MSDGGDGKSDAAPNNEVETSKQLESWAATDTPPPKRRIPTAPLATIDADTTSRLDGGLPEVVDNRYELGGRIGRGGTGDIYRALDRHIGKTVAIKLRHHDSRLSRQLAGRPPIENNLKHPALVGFTDQGHQGRWSWSVMPLIRGVTLDQIMAIVHPDAEDRVASTVPRPDQPESSSSSNGAPRTWSVEEAVSIIVGAASAMGVAHQAGIVHLDLKPDNLMFDEDTASPRVIDFGLAVYYEDAAPGDGYASIEIAGVAAYMAPERIAGEPATPLMDVYALGAMLYQLLTGQKPYGAVSAIEVRGLLAQGSAPHPVDQFPATRTEPEWCAVVNAAMALDPLVRPGDAAVFGEALRQATARRRLRHLAAALNRARELRKIASHYREHAKQLRATVPPWDDGSSLDDAWSEEAMADEFVAEASQREAIWAEDVRSILYGHPHLADAHAALADLYGERLVRAEIYGERSLEESVRETLARTLRRLEEATAASEPLGPTIPSASRERIAAIGVRARFLLRDQGYMTLLTDVPGAHVSYAAFAEKGRRLELNPFEGLGRTPLSRHPIPRGSGVLKIEAPGRPAVRYPIRIFRSLEWDSSPPGSNEPAPIHLPGVGEVAPGGCYVPGGWTWIGGDPRALDGLSHRRVWVPGFVMQRNPVTNAEFIEFLSDLEATGRPEDAHRYMPRLLSAQPGEVGPPFFVLDPSGKLVCERAPDDAPVRFVTWHAARAYANWRAAHSTHPWRLPSEWEYEKAARGVDGRRLPWGNHMDVRWTCVINSHESVAHPFPVGTPTRDISVYGIRWLAGNARMWCQERWSVLGPADGSRIAPLDEGSAATNLRISRGGSFRDAGPSVSTASRYSMPPNRNRPSVGVRLAYSLEPSPDDTSRQQASTRED